jgi:hypothetical protein
LKLVAFFWLGIQNSLEVRLITGSLIAGFDAWTWWDNRWEYHAATRRLGDYAYINNMEWIIRHGVLSGLPQRHKELYKHDNGLHHGILDPFLPAT